MDGWFFTGGLMFKIVPIFIGVVFIIVIGVILFTVAKGIAGWRKNEQSPQLSVPAVVKSKRTEITGSSDMNHDGDFHHHSTYTSYFMTYEFESGDRSEFLVSGNEYGLLSEGDLGRLTFQGTRYLGFERKKTQKNNL